MRNLTIKRAKSFVASLAKMKVYIEDPSGDTYIGKYPCRVLGTLKNGEEKTFEITSNEVKVFVIADLLSKDWCNDFYQLAQGDEDVTLTGKNRYNPAFGNGFIFDNNDNEASKANLKKGKRIGWIILACAVAVGFLIGFFGSNTPAPEAKTFTKENFSITLTDRFTEDTEQKDYFASYYNNTSAVFVVRETVEQYPDLKDYTLEDYAKLVVDVNSIEQQLNREDDFYYFEHVWLDDETGTVYHYTTYIFKSEGAFWMVTFAAPNDNYDDLKDSEAEWAESVSFE